MDFSYFDLIASVIILLLGLKGMLNGFFKELFGLVGIIGGIFIASRVGEKVGQALSDMIFNFENSAAIGFTGFLTTLAIFWLFMVGIGHLFKKLSLLSGLGIYDRIFGFIFGSAKFFLIAAVIAHAAYNIKAVRSTIDSSMSNSVLFPALVETGGYIMKLDPVEISDDINSTIDDVTDAVTDVATNGIKTSTQEIVDKTTQEIKSTMKKVN